MYINAKMSHKLDAPATLNVVSEGVQMSERSLKFAASKDHKRFALDLALHADIDPDVSEEEETETPREGGGARDAEREVQRSTRRCACFVLSPQRHLPLHAFITYVTSPLTPSVLTICSRARSRLGLLGG